MKRLLCVLLCLLLMLAAIPVQAASGKSFTLMIYMCGTDLESKSGAATSDLREMVKAGIAKGGNLTVYIQTGGTKTWKVNGISNRKAERWTLTSEGLTRVDSLGTVDMGDESTFADFLTYGFKHYPADRYGLIMWDHGSGASGGLCYDELTYDALFYPEIYGALKTASKASNYRKFSFIGFDACLMACYETALHVAPYADYMIASEESEPGSGWCYDQWLPTLVKNTAVDIPTLGKKIVDSFVSAASSSYYSGEYATLSIYDLSKLPSLTKAVESLGDSLKQAVTGSEYSSVARLRQNMRSFGELSANTATDMIDLAVVASVFSSFNSSAAKSITNALSEVVIYSKYTRSLTNISGMSILIPYSTRSSLSTYLSSYDQYSLSPKYAGFVNAMAKKLTSGSSGSSLGNVSVSTQSSGSAQLDWFGQYANDESSYYSTADSYSGSSSSGGFSLGDILSAIFGTSSSGGYNSSYDSSASSLWGEMEDSAGSSFSTSGSYNSSQGVQSTEAEYTLDDFLTELLTEGLDGLGLDVRSSQVTVTVDGKEYQLDNPLAEMGSSEVYTVTLTQDQLSQLGKVEANLMMDVSDPDFECYVEMGYVQNVVTDWNRGRIYGSFDGKWAHVNGQMVAIQDQIANENYIRSVIPVHINGEKEYLVVIFDEDTPQGRITGYTDGYNEAGYLSRGIHALKEGDIVAPEYQLIYWDAATGEQQSQVFLGNEITVGSDASLTYTREPVEADASYVYCFCLTDVYGNTAFTDLVPVELKQ